MADNVKHTDSGIQLDIDSVLETLNLACGVFSPLDGFLDEEDYRSVVEKMHLINGSIWTMPITLELPEEAADRYCAGREVRLLDSNGQPFAELGVTDVFRVDPENDITAVFGTNDRSHPGVAKELGRSPVRIAGRVLQATVPHDLAYDCVPDETRRLFAESGWKSVAGFQTRNPPHLAHEYLHRLAMEYCDGVFLHPLVGWKQKGDFTPRAVLESYAILVYRFYGPEHAFLGAFRTAMRYAGPREAVFHALVRKNFGCTHFIIGRDHAGAGNYYEKYEAQKLALSFNGLGITIMAFRGPYYCKECRQIVTAKTCCHGETFALHISGTQIRELLSRGELPPAEYIRPEISEHLRNLAGRKLAFCE